MPQGKTKFIKTLKFLKYPEYRGLIIIICYRPLINKKSIRQLEVKIYTFKVQAFQYHC